MSSVNSQNILNTFSFEILATILLLVILGVYAVLGIYGDGPLFLCTILTKKVFWDFDLPRIFIQQISQSPVVLALNLGVKNLTSLTYLHSFGAVGLTLLIWFAALYQQFRSSFFWTVLLAFSVTFLSSGFFSIGEYNITYALVGYCFALLLKDRLGYINCISLLIAAIALTHSYEAMIFLGPTLFLMCVGIFIQRWNSASLSPFEIISLAIAAFLFLLAAYVSAMSIENPRVPENLVGSIYNIKDTLKSTQFHFTIFTVVIYFLIPRISYKGQLVVMYFSVAISGLFIFVPSFWNAPGLQYVFRTTSGILLFFILVMTIFDRMSGLISFSKIEINGKPQNLSATRFNQSIVSLALWIGLLMPFLFYLAGFSQWIKRVEAAVLTQSQWVEIGKIPQLSGPFVTSWSTPALSIVLKGNSSAGLLNNSPVGWQPFDPLTLSGNPLESYRKGHPLYIYVPSK